MPPPENCCRLTAVSNRSKLLCTTPKQFQTIPLDLKSVRTHSGDPNLIYPIELLERAP
jgi:hypothetical protein